MSVRLRIRAEFFRLKEEFLQVMDGDSPIRMSKATQIRKRMGWLHRLFMRPGRGTDLLLTYMCETGDYQVDETDHDN